MSSRLLVLAMWLLIRGGVLGFAPHGNSVSVSAGQISVERRSISSRLRVQRRGCRKRVSKVESVPREDESDTSRRRMLTLLPAMTIAISTFSSFSRPAKAAAPDNSNMPSPRNRRIGGLVSKIRDVGHVMVSLYRAAPSKDVGRSCRTFSCYRRTV